MGNASRKDIDPKFLKPAGGNWTLSWDQKDVKKLIVDSKIAPFWTPQPDPNGDDFEECPICFFYFSGGLNRAKCCTKSICTECYLKIKQPLKDNIQCPFCNRASWQVSFSGPRSREEKDKEIEEEKRVTELMEKMRLAEIEQDRQREEQKRKGSAASSASNSVASSPAPGSPISLHNASPVASSLPPSPLPSSAPNSRPNSVALSPAAAPAPPSPVALNQPNTMTEEELEQAMIEEAIRISLLEEQQRQSNPAPPPPAPPAPVLDFDILDDSRSTLTEGSSSRSSLLGPTVTISNPFAAPDGDDDAALLEALRLSKELSSYSTINHDDDSSMSDDDEPADLIRQPREMLMK